MKIFSFRKIYVLHFLSKVDYLRAISRHPAPPIRGDLLSGEKLFKRSLTHVRHRSDIARMNQKFYQTSPGFQRYKIPRRYFLYFMSSSGLSSEDSAQFSQEKHVSRNIRERGRRIRRGKICRKIFTQIAFLSPLSRSMYNLTALFVYLLCNVYAVLAFSK